MRSFQDYTLLNEIFKRFTVDKIVLNKKSDDLWSIFKNNKKLVIALNHGPMMAPGYVNTSLLDILVKNGAADRTYVAVVWKHFYSIPGLGRLFKYMTQVEKPTSLKGFLEKYNAPGVNDLLVMPEGENCSYGNGIDIEPFLSPGFIEIAIRSNTPILLGVHHGTHLLANPVEISEKQANWFKWAPKKTFDRLKEARTISMPKPVFGKLPKLEYLFKLYQPSLKATELSEDKYERLEQLEKEAVLVRGTMQAMVDVLAGRTEEVELPGAGETVAQDKVAEIAA